MTLIFQLPTLQNSKSGWKLMKMGEGEAAKHIVRSSKICKLTILNWCTGEASYTNLPNPN